MAKHIYVLEVSLISYFYHIHIVMVNTNIYAILTELMEIKIEQNRQTPPPHV